MERVPHGSQCTARLYTLDAASQSENDPSGKQNCRLLRALFERPNDTGRLTEDNAAEGIAVCSIGGCAQGHCDCWEEQPKFR